MNTIIRPSEVNIRALLTQSPVSETDRTTKPEKNYSELAIEIAGL